jgi:hypothetical protein
MGHKCFDELLLVPVSLLARDELDTALARSMRAERTRLATD